MIQRIQSIFLLIVMIASGLSFVFPVWTAVDGTSTLQVTNLLVEYNYAVPLQNRVIEAKSTIESVWYCAMLAVIAGLLAGYTLFSFNKRMLQNQLCHFGTFVSSLWVGTYFITIPKAKAMMITANDGDYGFAFLAPILAIILFQAAAYFIRKDEELVRSADRIR